MPTLTTSSNLTLWIRVQDGLLNWRWLGETGEIRVLGEVHVQLDEIVDDSLTSTMMEIWKTKTALMPVFYPDSSLGHEGRTTNDLISTTCRGTKM
jgi:hypothetical protein